MIFRTPYINRHSSLCHLHLIMALGCLVSCLDHPLGWSPETSFAQEALLPTMTQPTESTTPSSPSGGESSPPSDAERVAALQRAIETDQTRLKELQAEVDDPESPFQKLQTEFKDLDSRRDRLRRELQQAQDEGQTTRVEDLKQQLTALESKWSETKKRFELELEAQRVKRSTIESLQQRLTMNRQLLQALLNPEKTAPQTPTTTSAENQSPAPSGDPQETKTESGAPPTAPQTSPTPTLPGVPTLPSPSLPPTTASSKATSSQSDADDPTIRRLQQEIDHLEKLVQQYDLNVQTIRERLDSIQRNITLERRLRDLARDRAQAAEVETRRLRQEYWNRLSQNDPQAPRVREQLNAAQNQLDQAQRDALQAEDRLDSLQAELTGVHSELLEATRAAERQRLELERARERLQALTHPLSVYQIERWVMNNGVHALLTVLMTAVVIWISRRLRHQVVRILAERSRRGSKEERENRAKTLVGVFFSSFHTLVYTLAAIHLLELVGISVTPLIGGAAVVGLAVAFGAQSLIKDYFTGFMILLEQQYMINDVVQIGNLSGQVEKITLRMTVLRALDGKVHFIPHGSIVSVTNLTHVWSRALFEITLDYSADIERVCQIVEDISKELRQDPLFASRIIEDVVILGVDDYRDAGWLMKFYITTVPLQQWPVRREFLKRMMPRLQREGISLAYPSVVVRTPPETFLSSHEKSHA
ncbi:MAG: hypothetical protein KatS3mg113_0995 [Planctomycetaceae bacterium]|nr:MAG: hypothetical protein KatS3mg113_0995 [Planctomycetaceae bacterium]